MNAVMGSAGIGPHHVSNFAGPLSVKFMVRGSGTWRSDAGVHAVEEGFFLILNHGQTYSLDIEGDLPRESFCPFFRRGFVEDIQRALTISADRLLDTPEAHGAPLSFHENLHPHEARVVPALLHLRRLTYHHDSEPPQVEEAFVRLGEALLAHGREDLPAQIGRVPASRSSTRAECHRRVAMARDYLHAHVDRPLELSDMASHACLSPYHFHRLFKAIHDLTPHQYLRRLRLERACRLLRDSDMPVTRIALAVGFESPASFSRCFAAVWGMAPSAYRGAGSRSGDRSYGWVRDLEIAPTGLRKNGKAPGG
jgi:AraC-like DNA-binding protein